MIFLVEKCSKHEETKTGTFITVIDGERVDFTKEGKLVEKKGFEDIPSNPDEIYLDQADYSTFFMRFVDAFEETVGLDNFRPGLSA